MALPFRPAAYAAGSSCAGLWPIDSVSVAGLLILRLPLALKFLRLPLA